jgi:ferredoxin-NADP reductase
MPTPLAWQIATVANTRAETAAVKTFTLHLPVWRPHRAGQHYDVRLTAHDGYQAQRSYSIASPPSRIGEIDLTVERVAGGEVSAYFHDVLEPGDLVEVRGPIGGYFVWEPGMGGPLLLIGGGSGVVPLMSMIRERAAQGDRTPTLLLASWRALEDVIYRGELAAIAAGQDGVRVLHTLTRTQPAGWSGYARRIDGAMLADATRTLGGGQPLAYICGPTLLVEFVAKALVDLGVPATHVRTERFGPTS